MEKLILKYTQLNSALDRLNEAVVDFEDNMKKKAAERLMDSLRDSMIQRFEFTLDLFWKYIKLYLEKELKKNIEFNSPKTVIREACKTKIITEQDSEKILKMVDDRNMSSHIYKEEIADDISSRIPEHYKIMEKYTQELKPENKFL